MKSLRKLNLVVCYNLKTEEYVWLAYTISEALIHDLKGILEINLDLE